MARAFFIAFLLSFGPAVANSFARFAYALVLPAMREDLGLSWSAAGALNTANAFGYLAGAVLTRLLVERIGNRRLFQAGMIVTALGVLATGLTRDPDALALTRVVAGVGGAAVFICGGALSGNILPARPDLGTTMIAIYFAGGGIGLVIGGLFIPLLFEGGNAAHWPIAWQVLGAISLVMAVAAAWAAARIEEPGPAGGHSASAATPPPLSVGPFLPELLAYLCFGLGYIGYMTFVVAWMREAGTSTSLVAFAWMLLGVTTIVAPLLWRGALERWPGGRPMALIMAVLAIGAWLPLAGTGAATMLLSAGLFGAAMFSVPSAISSLIKRSLPKTGWGTMMAVFTVAFAAGQTIGPIAAGWLADQLGGLRPGLYASVFVLLAGALLALLQPDTTQDRPSRDPAAAGPGPIGRASQK